MTLRNSWGEGSQGNNLQRADHDAPISAKNNFYSNFLFIGAGPLREGTQLWFWFLDIRLMKWPFTNFFTGSQANEKLPSQIEKQKICRIIFVFRYGWMRPFLAQVFVQMEFCGWLEPLISENPRSPRLSGKSQVRSSPRRKMWKATQRINADDFFGIFWTEIMLCMKCRTFCRRLLFLLKSFF